LIRGFEEWLPRQVGVEQDVVIEPVAFEARVYALEKKVWEIEKGGGGGKLEEEIRDFKDMVEVLMVENRALRENVGQLDSDQARYRWAVRQLGMEVEILKESQEVLEMGCSA
jgi:hypothetical protein